MSIRHDGKLFANQSMSQLSRSRQHINKTVNFTIVNVETYECVWPQLAFNCKLPLPNALNERETMLASTVFLAGAVDRDRVDVNYDLSALEKNSTIAKKCEVRFSRNSDREKLVKHTSANWCVHWSNHSLAKNFGRKQKTHKISFHNWLGNRTEPRQSRTLHQSELILSFRAREQKSDNFKRLHPNDRGNETAVEGEKKIGSRF